MLWLLSHDWRTSQIVPGPPKHADRKQNSRQCFDVDASACMPTRPGMPQTAVRQKTKKCQRFWTVAQCPRIKSAAGGYSDLPPVILIGGLDILTCAGYCDRQG